MVKSMIRTPGLALLGAAFASTAFADQVELGGSRAKEKMNAKRFGVYTILSLAALCALLSFSSRKAYADAILDMQLTGAQGASYANEYVYPYYGTADGNSVLLMCISFTSDMSLGETWKAEKESIPTSPTFEEAAWLFNDANAAVAANNTAQQIADQWAAWELFSPSAYNNPAPGTSTQMADAVADYASEPLSFYQGFVLYAPLPGSQNENGTPQFFLGYGDQTPTGPAPYGGSPNKPAYGTTPEPGTLGLMGTGLVGLVGLLRRKLLR